MREITTDELAEHSDRVLIDVREPDEFAAGRVPGAINIPLGQLTARLAEIPDGPIHVICQHGARSLRGARIIEGAGHDDVTSIDGGTAAWRESGRTLET